jgi:hypothetical protein
MQAKNIIFVKIFFYSPFLAQKPTKKPSSKTYISAGPAKFEMKLSGINVFDCKNQN